MERLDVDGKLLHLTKSFSKTHESTHKTRYGSQEMEQKLINREEVSE